MEAKPSLRFPEVPKFFQIGFAVKHENHPVVQFVQSQANVLKELVLTGIIKLRIERCGDFDYYFYSYDLGDNRAQKRKKNHKS